MTRPTVIRVALFIATTVAIWGVLSLGGAEAELNLVVGQPAAITYTAQRTVEGGVVDTEATEADRQAARDAVIPVRDISVEIQQSVEDTINSVFDGVSELVILETEPPVVVVPELPVGDEPSTTVGGAEEPAVITGTVFVDVDGSGDFNPEGETDRVDMGLQGIGVTIRTSEGETTTQTDAQGAWTAEITTGAAVVIVDSADPQIPTGWVLGSGELAQLVVCAPAQTCTVTDIGLVLSIRPVADIQTDIEARYPGLTDATVAYLAMTVSDDVVRGALGEPLHLPTVRQAALARVLEEFGGRIEPAQLAQAQTRQLTNPPLVFHTDTGQDEAGRVAAGEIVLANLQANYLIDETETQRLRDEAAAAVEPVTVPIVEGQSIVIEGQLLTQFHIDAIRAAAVRPTAEPASLGLLGLVAVVVAITGLYIARFRTEIWSRPRMVALLGIFLLMAAAAVRGTVAMEVVTSWYVLPAVAFGFMTAVLFDQRIALLMALAVGVITAAGTVDIGVSVYSVLAAMAPIPFVSAVSSRGAFRNAVVLSSLTAGVVAAATSWYFHVGPNDQTLQVVGLSVAWAFGVSAVASLVGLASLQYFETAFDITTTLSLLDLTDRNHEALQLLQEEAFGTFNHSLMVGTLADAAARAIGANPLLARAMAYYHDLGKTENPTIFIENQFGIPNPHDILDPRESAELIRSHVTSGVALARQFKIPTEVAQGIVSHHGDGVMRYFYEKARSQSTEEVNVDDFRHIGHKPQTAETAILMLADSLEAACRAVFQTEEPTPDAIEKVVNRIIDEKVEDGQLSESPLTLGELTQIRRAFLDSLIGHYHQRIAYPNFPGT
ncbi:MAG: HDIG domain-containing protein [Actinobacteria bacterium]|nr:HDIG domain-containing protein [Actinomycetota bacterium]